MQASVPVFRELDDDARCAKVSESFRELEAALSAGLKGSAFVHVFSGLFDEASVEEAVDLLDTEIGEKVVKYFVEDGAPILYGAPSEQHETVIGFLVQSVTISLYSISPYLSSVLGRIAAVPIRRGTYILPDASWKPMIFNQTNPTVVLEVGWSSSWSLGAAGDFAPQGGNRLEVAAGAGRRRPASVR